jgi:four helix bundle protein
MDGYKFQRLEVYQLGLEYLDNLYETIHEYPKLEEFNLKSQTIRAGTSIVLNIAEGSTCLSDAEQSRFLTMSIRSLLETAACLDIAERREYLTASTLKPIREKGKTLFVKLCRFRNSLQ